MLASGCVIMGFVRLGHALMPIAGVDPNDMEAFAAAMPNLGFEHLAFPLLGHALGTLVGACIAAFIAANHKMKFALGIGGLFLAGGIAVNYMLNGPTWFSITDILLAYIPMAWIGGKIGEKFSLKQ